MVPCLEEVDPVRAHQINDPVFLRQPAGPHIRSEVFQQFRLADAGKRVPQGGIDQVEGAERDLTIRFDPVAQILQELRVEDGIS